MVKKILYVIAVIAVVIVAVCAYGAWLVVGSGTTNSEAYENIAEIKTPNGYTRVPGDGFAEYLRHLKLKKKGSKVMLYTGGESRSQNLAYAVIDMPLLSNDEQCADVCMRLRAEYLYNNGMTSSIHFNNVGGKTERYTGGKNRRSFERYMRKLYGVASTYSLSRELPVRKLVDMQPGDVFVYASGDHSLEKAVGSKYGHAIMVVDVAVNSEGKKVYMLAEGNTPARDIHILKNWLNPFMSPWFSLDENATAIQISPFRYNVNELHYWK